MAGESEPPENAFAFLRTLTDAELRDAIRKASGSFEDVYREIKQRRRSLENAERLKDIRETVEKLNVPVLSREDMIACLQAGFTVEAIASIAGISADLVREWTAAIPPALATEPAPGPEELEEREADLTPARPYVLNKDPPQAIQPRIAWVGAWNRWKDGQIPGQRISVIVKSIHTAIEKMIKNHEFPPELKDDLRRKKNGFWVERSTVKRVLGKKASD